MENRKYKPLTLALFSLLLFTQKDRFIVHFVSVHVQIGTVQQRLPSPFLPMLFLPAINTKANLHLIALWLFGRRSLVSHQDFSHTVL